MLFFIRKIAKPSEKHLQAAQYTQTLYTGLKVGVNKQNLKQERHTQ